MHSTSNTRHNKESKWSDVKYCSQNTWIRDRLTTTTTTPHNNKTCTFNPRYATLNVKLICYWKSFSFFFYFKSIRLYRYNMLTYISMYNTCIHNSESTSFLNSFFFYTTKLLKKSTEKKNYSEINHSAIQESLCVCYNLLVVFFLFFFLEYFFSSPVVPSSFWFYFIE